MNDLKGCLKEAKNAIKDKDFEAAMIHCKDALKIDRKNYQALVMLGKVYIEDKRFTDSKKALMLASQVEPENPVAWQGLLNLHEKNSYVFDQEEELSVLNHSKDIAKEDEKLYDIYSRLAKFHERYGSPLEAVSVLEALLGVILDESKAKDVRKDIVRFLRSIEAPSNEIINQLIKNFEYLLNDSALSENEKNHQDFIKLLYKSGEINKSIVAAIKMSQIFPTSYPLEWIARIHVETFNKVSESSQVTESVNADDLSKYVSKLLALSPLSPWGNFAFGLNLLREKKYSEAKRFLKLGCEKLGSHLSVWLLFLSILKDNRDISSIEVVCRRIFSLLDDNPDLKLPGEFGDIGELRSYLFHSKLDALVCLGRPKHLREVVASLRNVEKLNIETLSMLISAQLKLGLCEEASNELEKLKEICKSSSGLGYPLDVLRIMALVASANKDHDCAKSIYQRILQDDPEDSNSLLELGKIYYDDEDYSSAIALLLKAAKVNPKSSSAFVYIGHYYYRLGANLEKARKCYERAFNLDFSSEEAGLALSDFYRENGHNEANFALLLKVTKDGISDWAWLRLGLHYIAVKEYNEAVNTLQKAVELNPNDRIPYECLGDAYFSRGSYVAALKVFTKAMEISPTEAFYSRCKISHINHLLGDYLLSISQYESVLSDDLPKTVRTVALVGLAEVLIARAKKYKQGKLFSNMKEDCLKAIRYLTRSASDNPEIVTIWKLLGDACTFQSCMPSSLARFDVPARLLDFSVHDLSKSTTISRCDILQLGARCYGVGLKISEDNAILWHDLGINLFLQGYCDLTVNKESKTSAQDIEFKTEEMKCFASRSLAALRKSLSIDSSSFNVWNSCGVVALFYDDLALAQHSLIQSLEIRPTVEAWTNLGALYLQQKDTSLAHEAFCQAQSLNPRYVHCWIGQAMVASIVGHYEAFDLYRHTTQLDIHPESCLGFASKVLSIKHEDSDSKTANVDHFLPNVLDCLTFYAREHDRDVAGFLMQGVCAEMLNLFHTAYEAFSIAGKINVSASTDVRDIIYSNLARICLILNKLPEAISSYSSIKEHTFHTQCGMALAKLKAAQYEEAYQAYSDACEWFAVNDSEKGQVLTALAFLHYKFGKIDDVKTYLFQSVNISPSLESRLALAALGLVEGDAVLTDAALTDIVPMQDSKEYVQHVAFLKAVQSMMQGNYQEAKLILCRSIRRHPNNSALWRSLARVILWFPSDLIPTSKADCAAHSAVSTAIVLSQAEKNQKYIVQDVVLRAFCCLKSSSTGNGAPRQLSLIEAQKAVLMSPASPETWAVLVSTLQFNSKKCDLAKKWKNYSNSSLRSWFEAVSV